MIWIAILDPDYTYRPTKTINPVGMVREHAPGLSIFLYGLSVWDPACLLGVYSCSMTGHAKKVPDPTACRDALSVNLPSCRGFHNRLTIFLYNPTTFATDPRVMGSVTGSVRVETLH